MVKNFDRGNFRQKKLTNVPIFCQNFNVSTVVSHGQTTFLAQGVITCGISIHAKKHFLVQALLLQAITPCARTQPGHARLCPLQPHSYIVGSKISTALFNTDSAKECNKTNKLLILVMSASIILINRSQF